MAVKGIYLDGKGYFPDVSGKKFKIKEGHYYNPVMKNLWTNEVEDMGKFFDQAEVPQDMLTAIKCFTYNKEMLVLATYVSDNGNYAHWATPVDNVVWDTGGG